MSKKALALSIVIPAYNEESYLEACLLAIAKQTVMPDEVIVVDNNSTDRTAQIAKSFKFVRVITAKKQGRVFARNVGFDAAKGDIIGRIDADTHLPPDWVEQVQQFYANPHHTNQAVTGGCAFYNLPLPKLDEWITSQFVFRMNRALVGHYILWGSNMALPRQLWQKVRGKVCLRNDIHEDLDLAFHLHDLGYGINYQAGLVVGARMGRVFSDRGELWPVLMMWPRSLRTHGIMTWPLSYLGAIFLYCSQPVPLAANQIAKLFGRTPKN